MVAYLEVYHKSAPHYACATVSGDGAGAYEAMQEALRLETKSGLGGWMIRDHRSTPPREYPAFLSRRPEILKQT